MNTHKNTIRMLEKIRDVYHSQLDISVITELNAVIADLKAVTDSTKNETQLFTQGLRALQVISVVISLVSNLKDLMK
jgi:small basic protein